MAGTPSRSASSPRDARTPSRTVAKAPARASANRGLSPLQTPQPAPVSYDPGYVAGGISAPVVVMAKPSWSRPGVVTASCVLGFILAGLTLIASVIWFFADDVGDRFGKDSSLPLVRGFCNLTIAILLTLGGILAMTRQPVGRMLTIGGAAALLLYGVFRLTEGWYGAIFSIFAGIVVAALLLTPPASKYFATRSPLGHD